MTWEQLSEKIQAMKPEDRAKCVAIFACGGEIRVVQLNQGKHGPCFYL